MEGAGQAAVMAGWGVGLVLAVAGSAKLRLGGAAVLPFLRALGIASPPARRAAAAALPVAEVATGGWLLSGAAPVAAAAWATLLCLGFATALAVAAVRGIAEPCRCLGVLERSPSHRLALARALLLLAGAVAALAASLAARGGGADDPGGGEAAWVWAARGTGALLAGCWLIGFALLAEAGAFRRGVGVVLAGGAEE